MKKQPARNSMCCCVVFNRFFSSSILCQTKFWNVHWLSLSLSHTGKKVQSNSNRTMPKLNYSKIKTNKQTKHNSQGSTKRNGKKARLYRHSDGFLMCFEMRFCCVLLFVVVVVPYVCVHTLCPCDLNFCFFNDFLAVETQHNTNVHTCTPMHRMGLSTIYHTNTLCVSETASVCEWV